MGPRRVAYAVIAVASLALPLLSMSPAHSGVGTEMAVQPFLAASASGVIAERTLGMVYRVQTGAYRVRENAQVQADQLRREGFTPLITRARVLYKVQVGAFTSRRDADRLAEDLKTRGYEVFVTP